MTEEKPYPSIKEIICLLGMGVLITGAIFSPGAGILAREIVRYKRKKDWADKQKSWSKFNAKLLKINLNRLKKQQVVEIIHSNGEEIVKLTRKGEVKYLTFKLQELSIKGKKWDGKWRLVIYDISKFKRKYQEYFRRMLRSAHFYQLQKSVYLTPYNCQKEIEYLRQYFHISQDVLILEVSKLENEIYYKKYFGL